MRHPQLARRWLGRGRHRLLLRGRRVLRLLLYLEASVLASAGSGGEGGDGGGGGGEPVREHVPVFYASFVSRISANLPEEVEVEVEAALDSASPCGMEVEEVSRGGDEPVLVVPSNTLDPGPADWLRFLKWRKVHKVKVVYCAQITLFKGSSISLLYMTLEFDY